MYKLASLLNIHAGELKTTFLLIGMMLFSAMGFSLGGTGIEALYFARFGTDLLPYLYMGLGILSLITSLAITGLLGRVKRERFHDELEINKSITVNNSCTQQSACC